MKLLYRELQLPKISRCHVEELSDRHALNAHFVCLYMYINGCIPLRASLRSSVSRPRRRRRTRSRRRRSLSQRGVRVSTHPSCLANDLIREQWVSINNPVSLSPLLPDLFVVVVVPFGAVRQLTSPFSFSALRSLSLSLAFSPPNFVSASLYAAFSSASPSFLH